MKLIFEIEVKSSFYTKENGIEAEREVGDLLYQFCRNVKRRKDLEETLILKEKQEMNVKDNILEKVKKLADEYYKMLQKDTSYNRINNYFSFNRSSIIKDELDFILSEIPIIIEDLISSKSVNKKLSDINKKLVDRLNQLENNIALKKNYDFNINYAGIEKKVAEKFINNHELELKLRLDNLTNRVVEIEYWIKRGHQHPFEIVNDCIR